MMLFSCLLYFAFGLMYAYQEVLNEMRNVITMKDKTDMVLLREPFTREQIQCALAVKYLRIVGTLGFIFIGLAFYALRRIKIVRAMGTLSREEDCKVVYKRVNSFKIACTKSNGQTKVNTDSILSPL